MPLRRGPGEPARVDDKGWATVLTVLSAAAKLDERLQKSRLCPESLKERLDIATEVRWPALAFAGRSAGDEVLGLGVVADDGAGGLLGDELVAGVLVDLEADAVGFEQ